MSAALALLPQGSLAEGHGSRKRPCPWVFPSSPPWPQKLLGSPNSPHHAALLCSAAREGAQTLLHPRKRKQTWDFYSPQVSVGMLAQEGTGCRTQGHSQSGALVYQLLTSPPSTLPPLPVPQSRHLHHRDAKASYINCPQSPAALFHARRQLCSYIGRPSLRRLQSRTHIVNHTAFPDSLFSVSPPTGF